MMTEEKDIEKRERASTASGAHDSDAKYQDAEFGGPEERKKLERRFLLKLDLRMSIMVIIYILNYVCIPLPSFDIWAFRVLIHWD